MGIVLAFGARPGGRFFANFTRREIFHGGRDDCGGLDCQRLYRHVPVHLARRRAYVADRKADDLPARRIFCPGCHRVIAGVQGGCVRDNVFVTRGRHIFPGPVAGEGSPGSREISSGLPFDTKNF